MIFCCKLFNNEFECLEIQCHEMKDLDVIHVLVESRFTFTGIEKPAYYHDRLLKEPDYLSEFNIINYVCDDMPNTGNPWDNERHQRNCIRKAIDSFERITDDDWVILSDGDEVIRAESIKEFNPELGITALVMDKMGYFVNCVEQWQGWNRAKIMTYSYFKKHEPDIIRNCGQEPFIENAGWHFSYLGGVEKVMQKFNSFSHTEVNKPELNNVETLTRKLKLGESLWSHDSWTFVELDDTFPKYLLENQEKYKELIKQL